MLADYDHEPIAALTTALRIVLDRPSAAWPELVHAAGLTDTRTAALLVGDERTLDELLTELNELRALATER
ncbi:MAG TPA: hypothetical protein VGM78_13230 [Ilumatobacteraceae bacterium]|jgi:hypothetical protein